MEPLLAQGFLVVHIEIRSLMFQVARNLLAEIVIQHSAGFREDLLHSGDIWMDGKTRPLCLERKRQMLSQGITKKSKEAIPDAWNCLFLF